MIFRRFSHFLGIDLIDFGFSKIEKETTAPGPAFGPRHAAHRARRPAKAVRPTATVAEAAQAEGTLALTPSAVTTRAAHAVARSGATLR
jgi:hypothetical protein